MLVLDWFKSHLKVIHGLDCRFMFRVCFEIAEWCAAGVDTWTYFISVEYGPFRLNFSWILHYVSSICRQCPTQLYISI